MAEQTRKADRIWALYKGDEFITSGTIYEIAEATGKRFDSLMFLTRPAYKKRKDFGNRLQIYEVDEDE
ncbi:hypothetical protein [Fructobacillus evanidus]|uniref:Phage protein n=1 Tax=Fructobacillus evanidus TaxID=3064281 RepID=A0ABN9YJ92_9LACO|nr:hypothetical protein R55250_KEHBDPNM_00163 [Fructobacillus sp. LMG 32999]CAK1222158.1 hypothetical protein R53718_MFFEMHAI_00165 [Fructobacillus sp. LMG 32999]CAK1226093.1 hypothetical protein R54837_OMAIDLJD_00130 [Fructobacillus sp. LMG 32999]CAK1226333.1 hypothetical protein R53534_HOPDCFKK_00132 [Fructobacillus sp. LMG 32999]CAK1226456.1 hypothetical protein R55214_HHFBAMCI_00141 [Fructobacillus sp. LMG 32999]